MYLSIGSRAKLRVIETDLSTPLWAKRDTVAETKLVMTELHRVQMESRAYARLGECVAGVRRVCVAYSAMDGQCNSGEITLG